SGRATGDAERERPADACYEAGEADRDTLRAVRLEAGDAAACRRDARGAREEERYDEQGPPAAHAPTVPARTIGTCRSAPRRTSASSPASERSSRRPTVRH